MEVFGGFRLKGPVQQYATAWADSGSDKNSNAEVWFLYNSVVTNYFELQQNETSCTISESTLIGLTEIFWRIIGDRVCRCRPCSSSAAVAAFEQRGNGATLFAPNGVIDQIRLVSAAMPVVTWGWDYRVFLRYILLWSDVVILISVSVICLQNAPSLVCQSQLLKAKKGNLNKDDHLWLGYLGCKEMAEVTQVICHNIQALYHLRIPTFQSKFFSWRLHENHLNCMIHFTQPFGEKLTPLSTKGISLQCQPSILTLWSHATPSSTDIRLDLLRPLCCSAAWRWTRPSRSPPRRPCPPLSTSTPARPRRVWAIPWLAVPWIHPISLVTISNFHWSLVDVGWIID